MGSVAIHFQVVFCLYFCKAVLGYHTTCNIYLPNKPDIVVYQALFLSDADNAIVKDL